MAIIQALVAFISRSFGKILSALFDWAVIAIFGYASGTEKVFLSALLAAAGAWPLLVLGWRRRRSRLREALGRMIDRPERVAVEPTATQRILGAAGSAAAAFLIKAALERAIRPRDAARRAAG